MFKPYNVTEAARLLALYRWPMHTQVDEVRINTEVMERMLTLSGALDVLAGKVKRAQPAHLVGKGFQKKAEAVIPTPATSAGVGNTETVEEGNGTGI